MQITLSQIKRTLPVIPVALVALVLVVSQSNGGEMGNSGSDSAANGKLEVRMSTAGPEIIGSPEAYNIAFETCATFDDEALKELAFGSSSRDDVVDAVVEMLPNEFAESARSGCLAGFLDRDKRSEKNL